MLSQRKGTRKSVASTVMTAHQVSDGSRIIEINGSQPIRSVFFTEDGKQVWGGGNEGMIRQWRVDDGHEVDEPIRTGGTEIYAAALSPDRRWLACGLGLEIFGLDYQRRMRRCGMRRPTKRSSTSTVTRASLGHYDTTVGWWQCYSRQRATASRQLRRL